MNRRRLYSLILPLLALVMLSGLASVAGGTAPVAGTTDDREVLRPLAVPPAAGKHVHDASHGHSGDAHAWVTADTACSSVPEPGEAFVDPEQCTHGVDPLPPGATGAPVRPLGTRDTRAARVACAGNGQDGARVQMLYVRAVDRSDRFGQYESSFQTWTAQMDDIFVSSAPDSPEPAHVRFVHDDGCRPVIARAVVPANADDSFDATVDALRDLGYDRSDRKYVAFVDANMMCGVGTIFGDDRPSYDNTNNTAAGYSRADVACWGAHTIAHELMHNLGGVQLSAPNSSGGYHCTDESDVMCYSDDPSYPAMRQVCPTSAEMLFDCGNDDYYDASPTPGSYLDRHWNAATSRFLTIGGERVCADRALEPDDDLSSAGTTALGVTVPRALCDLGDEDWTSFPVRAGYRYTAETLNLGDGVDTLLEVVTSIGSVLAGDDDSGEGLGSRVVVTAGSAGELLVRVRSYAGGIGGTYALRVTETAPPTGTTLGAGRLRNGGFETDADRDGRPDLWTRSTAFSRVPRTVGGGRWTGLLSATRNRDVVIQQRVTGLRPGDYFASGMTRVPTTRDPFKVEMRIVWEDADLRPIGQRQILVVSRSTAGSGAGRRLVQPARARSALVQLVVTSLATRVYVDSLAFTPAT